MNAKRRHRRRWRRHRQERILVEVSQCLVAEPPVPRTLADVLNIVGDQMTAAKIGLKGNSGLAIYVYDRARAVLHQGNSPWEVISVDVDWLDGAPQLRGCDSVRRLHIRVDFQHRDDGDVVTAAVTRSI